MSPDPRVKILMVDDQPQNLLALEAVLESLGQDLVRAGSGEEALRCLIKDDFAVILLDVQMPGMDGFETASLIRSRRKNRSSPIIFLTAAEKSEAKVFQGYEVGAVDYLLKPINPEILRSKVRNIIELQQKNAEIVRLNAELLQANAGLEYKVKDRVEALEESSKALGRSNEELAQFATVAAHDLQEPLRTMNTQLQLLRKNNQGRLSGEDDELMETALGSARRMRQLIIDLLAFAQVGGEERILAEVDCGALLKATLVALKEKIKAQKASVRVGEMPTLRAEPHLLSLVFQNLIENALKFQKGKPPVIEISSQVRGGTWVFGVKDNGIGVDPEHHEKIFKLFQRLHTRDEFPGSGLGLPICKKVVERHGGEIWLESRPGFGTTFYFSIPSKG